MKYLIKKILREHKDKETLSDTIFFKTVKQLLQSNPEMFAGEYSMDTPYERAQDMSNVLKLFGISPNNEELASKLYWAAYDNRDSVNMGTAKSYDDLELRPLKQYRVTCEENWTEHVWYTWEPIVEAYDEDDAEQDVYYDEDGQYGYWEWENEPGFDKDYGDTDSDGKEITGVVEVQPDEPTTLTEAEGPEENELVDGLRDILHKQKEAHSEDSWYNDIEKLLKRLKIPLQEHAYGSTRTSNEKKLTEMDARALNYIFKDLGCEEIKELANRAPYNSIESIQPITKLYGIDLGVDGDLYAKQLIQFMVDKGCKEDYTSFIGESLPSINEYDIGQTYIEWDKLEKDVSIIIQDTNFKSAMCEAKEHFWDYEYDIRDSEIMDSDYVGDEEWSYVGINGKEKWSSYGVGSGYSNFDPEAPECE